MSHGGVSGAVRRQLRLKAENVMGPDGAPMQRQHPQEKQWRRLGVLIDDIKCAEAYVRFLCERLLDHCYDDMEFMTKFIYKTALQRLEVVAKSKFHRVTYTEAVAILEEVAKLIDFPPNYDNGYLTEEKFKAPIIVYNYPKAIKAWYMKVNEDDKTVVAMDVLVPKVGELIGCSQREENYDVLKQRLRFKHHKQLLEKDY
ncbi:asparagine--tRNA ligase, cytoplasmic 1-like [Sesamum indicum]|uniref:Asparagine--tRNA ligase, cytoplasmic 1-like n=1 Tax=Sesamum indicum TaxID=4182 RepID=A0A8M8VFU9_SESIN|nr:asparagine--tRNA ligase, cytoplasmic 1-like [Sesamum indicum]